VSKLVISQALCWTRSTFYAFVFSDGIIDTLSLRVFQEILNLFGNFCTIKSKRNNLSCHICWQWFPTRSRYMIKKWNVWHTVFYERHDENNVRLFFQCPNIRGVWSYCNFTQIVNDASAQVVDVSPEIFSMLQQLNKEDYSLFSTILWSIWSQHNTNRGKQNWSDTYCFFACCEVPPQLL